MIYSKDVQLMSIGKSKSYDLFNDWSGWMREGMRIQVGTDVVMGSKNNQNNANVYVASANAQNGLYFHGIVNVKGGAYNITFKTETPQVNDN